jgi:TolB-like protein/Flp pilus assembly protein TadD
MNCWDQQRGRMLGAAVRGPCMATERKHAPLSTEVSPLETEVDPQASGRCDSAAALAQAELTAPHERLATGHRLSDRYRIERELGEGGMGVVYLVTDEQVVGETFAIKVLKEGLHPEALTLLREEVHKARRLSHPNIVDVHSVNVDGTRLYVLMENLEGKSLNALLDEEFGRGMPLSRAWPIIEDVGAALGYAHDHSVIHSDLKPANVFVTTLGRTKLLDFGIARVSRGPLLHKQSGPLALTPAYASCEMLKGKEADRRDDIYSFACVIYEMLSGERPFGELTALEAREAGSQVPPLEMLTRGQNAALANALAFDREGRTSSVEKLLEGLAADKRFRARPIGVLGGAIIAAVAALGLTYLALDKLWISRHSVMVQSVTPVAQPAASPASGTGATFNPPPHSIAVLPFVNMSGDPGQEYFSDGLTEELLNSLSRTNELQVAGRTSSFYFKGEHADLFTIARKLNVAAVLEGSVRRSGHRVRITTQLINAVTGFHTWSQTYDRDLGDVLKLQTEIATAVASALKITLLGDEAANIELGGTRNPGAFDAYLRGSKAARSGQGASSYQSAIAGYTEAIRLDPNYALAFAGRSLALSNYAGEFAKGRAILEFSVKAQADARQALKLAPELAEGHLALARFLATTPLDFTHASEAYERAMALAPGDAEVLADSGLFAASMGRFDVGLAAASHAVALDPLNPRSRYVLGEALFWARRYQEAVTAFGEVISLEPDFKRAYGFRGVAYYWLGDLQSARSVCETKPDHWSSMWCLAVTYEKLGRHADAEAELKKLQAAFGDNSAYQCATIYSVWGNTAKALEWLARAVRLPDPGVKYVKIDALMDPLRNEPRFQAIERELKFPN